mmetsp:Transcript_72577/g.115822  ORF Transcript_72577/g.115822 Transcript_72577/m.115822 type:complete len:327 (+) Transcript_72577:330-1310(+)
MGNAAQPAMCSIKRQRLQYHHARGRLAVFARRRVAYINADGPNHFIKVGRATTNRRNHFVHDIAHFRHAVFKRTQHRILIKRVFISQTLHQCSSSTATQHLLRLHTLCELRLDLASKRSRWQHHKDELIATLGNLDKLCVPTTEINLQHFRLTKRPIVGIKASHSTVCLPELLHIPRASVPKRVSHDAPIFDGYRILQESFGSVGSAPGNLVAHIQRFIHQSSRARIAPSSIHKRRIMQLQRIRHNRFLFDLQSQIQVRHRNILHQRSLLQLGALFVIAVVFGIFFLWWWKWRRFRFAAFLLLQLSFATSFLLRFIDDFHEAVHAI